MRYRELHFPLSNLLTNQIMTPSPGTPINFIIGNHKPCVVTEDVFEYVVQGFKKVGQAINYSVNNYHGDAINILMEGCKIGTAKTFAQMRLRYPNSRLYMIATEILTDKGFNSANTVHSRDGEHYSDSGYWGDRTQGFLAMVPQLDGLIFLAESLFDGYKRLNLRSHYLPLVALPGYPVIQREPEPQRDFDVFFSGTVTDYRTKVIERLEQEGFQVFLQSTQYPEYMRRHFLARSKLAIGLRLSDTTQFTSKQRAHYYLVNRIPHVFETTPDHTDLHEFIQFAEPGDAFLERCFELLNGVHAFPEHVFDDFCQCEKFNHVTVFRDFLQYLRQ